MPHSLNKVMLIGNLGTDPQLSYHRSGFTYTSFSIITSDTWKDEDGNAQEKTECHNIIARQRNLVEVCSEYLKKGRKVYIEGKLQTRNYEKDGIKLYVTEIVADQLIMLGSAGVQRETDSSSSTELIDPFELTVEYKRILPELEIKIINQLAMEGYPTSPTGMGWCYLYWQAKKKVLENEYDVVWNSPTDLNPDIFFD